MHEIGQGSALSRHTEKRPISIARQMIYVIDRHSLGAAELERVNQVHDGTRSARHLGNSYTAWFDTSFSPTRVGDSAKCSASSRQPQARSMRSRSSPRSRSRLNPCAQAAAARLM